MAKLLEKPDIAICEWTAALYEEKKRKWLYGCLLVKATEVVFEDANVETENSREKRIIIPYEDFVGVHKATTGFVFGAVYILKKNNEKVWFSSLPDREGVYGALKHFWRQGLFQNEGIKRKTMSKGRTEMGQRLLGIVEDSEQTLNKAAVQLVEQGHQIDSAISTMADLDSDLDIVDNLVSDLQSWIGRWIMPDQYESIDPVFINKSEIPEVFEYEVLFTKMEMGTGNTKTLGTFRVSKGGLTILNGKKRAEHHYNWCDVSQLRVITPWEMIVIQNKIGQPDLKYSLISVNMVAILKLLNKCAKYKLKYDTPPDRVVCIKNREPDTSRTSSRNEGHVFSKFGAHESNKDPTKKTGIQPIVLDYGTEIQVSKQVVSEMEAEQISQSLVGLKSLALSVQKEESRQNERIDSLTESVDRANPRIVVNEKKVKRLK